jgi:hypothetical protein
MPPLKRHPSIIVSIHMLIVQLMVAIRVADWEVQITDDTDRGKPTFDLFALQNAPFHCSSPTSIAPFSFLVL